MQQVRQDEDFMRMALRLARRGYGRTSPNPMVGAVLVKKGEVIGQGWHHQAGEAHAEIEAIRHAQKQGGNVAGATLYVTLEPCCTHGRTGPCTEAILAAGIKRVVAGAIDPNPAHAGKGLRMLKRAGVEVSHGVMAEEADRLNEAFNHWIVHRTPFVTVKAAMTLDGKIGTAQGESKWISGPAARDIGMKLREGADAILTGVNTILADDPSLTFRPTRPGRKERSHQLRRIILDSEARTPFQSRVVADEFKDLTVVVVTPQAPAERVAALGQKVQVWKAPMRQGRVDLRWLLKRLGKENVTSLLVEGGGEVNAAFLLDGLAHRVAFFYAPKILGGRAAIKAVSGAGLCRPQEWLRLEAVEWRKVGADLYLSARVKGRMKDEE